MGPQVRGGGGRVLRLDAEEGGFERAGDALGQLSPSLNLPRGDRTDKLQATLVQGRNMVWVAVHEQHLAAGSDERCTEAAPDRACSPDENRRFPHAQGPSSRARVSSTATCQMASMSS